jgi:hypothetical protein
MGHIRQICKRNLWSRRPFKSGGDLGFVLNEDVDFSMPLGYIKKAWNIRNRFDIQFDNSEYDLKNKKWAKEGLFVQFNSQIQSMSMLINFRTYRCKGSAVFKINSDPKNIICNSC